MIKVLLLVAAGAGLVACAPIPTLDELQAEAAESGDWSKVERREKLLEVKGDQRPPTCPEGFIGYCEVTGYDRHCGCRAAGSSVLR